MDPTKMTPRPAGWGIGSCLARDKVNGSNEDDTKTERVGDRELSRKRQSLRKKPRREDGRGVARGGTTGGW